MKFTTTTASFWMRFLMGGPSAISAFSVTYGGSRTSSSVGGIMASSMAQRAATTCSYRTSACVLHMAGGAGDNKKDEYDDWYADFDPSLYEAYPAGGNTATANNDSFDAGPSRPSRGGGGGGGRERSSYGGGGGRGGGGGGGGSHDYVRDTSRDSSNVDEAAVDQLLGERVAAKRRRDFDTADAIRDQLLQDYAVGVYDKDRTWRTGASASGSGMRGGGGRGGGGGGGDRFGGGNDRGGGRERRGGGGGRGPSRDFGPNGHDYSLSADAGPINSEFTESEVHELLAERLQAKMSRNFDLADSIQSQLISSGVYVHDGRKEWRADGVPFGDLGRSDGRPGRTQGSSSDRNQPYQKSLYSAEAVGDEDEIQNLVDERSKFKQLRAYDKADAIKEELLSEYNVYLDDREREWSLGGDFGKEYNTRREMDQSFRQRGYAKSGSSLDLSPQDEAFVTEKLEERSMAKRDRDFDTADAIRDELEDTFNVMINDKMRLWSVGGDFAADGGPKRPGGGYVRRGGGGGDLSEEDVQTITEMLATRFQAKKDRHFKTADEIRDNLRETYNIMIDDKNQEWHVDTDEYVFVATGGSNPLAEEDVEIITAKLQERFACKADRNYERADEIRDELAQEYDVAIDDRTKEWRCIPSQGDGASYQDRRFQEEAASSQASAFKRTQPERDLDDELDSILDDEITTNSSDDDDEDEEESDEDVVSAGGSAGDDISEEALLALKVPELKEKLRDAGLPVSGNKAELIERLLESSAQ